MPSRSHALLFLAGCAAASLPGGCAPGPAPSTRPAVPVTQLPETTQARLIFEANIEAIHRRDRDAYLSYYVHTPLLARNGPGGLDLGFEGWSARRDTTWPDTLVARDLRVIQVAPGVVYGTYHYRVTQRGVTSEGISERVLIRTGDGWRIGVSTAFGLPQGAAPPPVALLGGTLVNPGLPPIPDAVVVIQNGLIACAGPAGAGCVPPLVAEPIRVDGTFIAPGLIDAQVHFSQSGWVDGRPDQRAMPAGFAYDSALQSRHADLLETGRAYLCSGITGAFDAGGFPWTLDLAERSRDALDLPLVVAAGPMLGASREPRWSTDWNLPGVRQIVSMESESGVRAAVRANALMGAGAIMMLYGDFPESSRPGLRILLQAAAAEAGSRGLSLVVHATSPRNAREAVEAGARILVASGWTEPLDPDLVGLIRARNVIVVPTLGVLEGYREVYSGRPASSGRYSLDCVGALDRARLESTLSEERRGWGGWVRDGTVDRYLAMASRNLRTLYEAGVAIAAGSDAGNSGSAHGASLVRELELMRRAGMPDSAVFRAATLTAARVMGLERELGTIAAGKRADLVVFEGDPTVDINAVKRIRWVMRNGALYGRAELLPR